MVDFQTIGRVFQRMGPFRTLVLGTLCVNFLWVGYSIVTSDFISDLTLLDSLVMIFFGGLFFYFMVFGLPVLVAFFVHLSRTPEPVAWWDLSSIPENSTLYDAIMLPTVHCGPIKVILPVVPEDAVLEGIED